MKTLYLVRHAKSSWKDYSLDDIDRPLNKRGKRDAPFMGQLIANKGILPDVLISSPAVRAHTTAKAFAAALKIRKKEILLDSTVYEASLLGLLENVQNLNNKWNSVMLFGHNMTYTSFANFYAKPILDNVPTCAVVAIEFDVKKWNDVTTTNGRVVLFEYPRYYFPKK